MFFCNSGAEAMEGALKLARATSKEQNRLLPWIFPWEDHRALSVTGREKYQKYFHPLVPDCYGIPYGDLESLEKIIFKKDVAAFIVEPIQGEGGIIVPPEGYLKGARALCDRYEVLLIVDEIQTGFGRTGSMFACQHEDVVPDIICLAKSLGGSVMPIGYVAEERVWGQAWRYGQGPLHTSTFGVTARPRHAIATVFGERI